MPFLRSPVSTARVVCGSQWVGSRDAAVSGDDPPFAINQHRIHEAELCDAVRYLLDLPFGMGARVARARFQIRYRSIDDRLVALRFIVDGRHDVLSMVDTKKRRDCSRRQPKSLPKMLLKLAKLPFPNRHLQRA
jgi:hypothetical protein